MSGSGERLRVAVVGAGGVATRHVATLASFDDCEVVAVADPAPGAAERLATTVGAAAHTDVEAMLDAARPDAVYVCVPPFAHGRPERAVLARGLPLFVEKPLAADLATAEALAAEVEAAGVVTATGYHWRCLDTVAEARRLLADRPAALVHGAWLDKVPPVAWWLDRRRSGGQVVEQLTHVLDLARVTVGEVDEVYAATARTGHLDGDADVDDVSAATLRFASGAVGTLSATCLLGWKHEAALQIYGPGLALHLSEEELVIDTGRGPEVQRPTVDPRLEVDRQFLDAVRGRPAPGLVDYAEALRSHRVACALSRSAASGRVEAAAAPDG